jgi:hypothetical protein
MIGPPERVSGEQIARLRSVGYAAFGRHNRDLAVLDLVYDSFVDGPGDDEPGVRRLRFTGHGVTLDVERTGDTVELWITPPGPVVVETRGGDGTTDGASERQLVSFVLRWPGGEQRPVRTAWIML